MVTNIFSDAAHDISAKPADRIAAAEVSSAIKAAGYIELHAVQ